MKRLVLLLVIIMSFTGVSLGTIGKALLTPFHFMMGFAIVFAFFFEQKARLKVQVALLPLIIFIVVSNLFIHAEVRITSVIYTVTFSLEYLILYRMMISTDKDTIIKALGLIQTLYFINILIALVLIAAGIQVHEGGLINIYYGKEGDNTRPMGFSSEPSYAGFILAISMLAFSNLRHHTFDRYTKTVFFCFFCNILMMNSAYGFLFLALNLLDWGAQVLNKSTVNTKAGLVIVALGMFTILPAIISKSDNSSIKRISNLIEGFSDTNSSAKKKLKKLQETDGSAFARIGPTYMMIYGGDEININWMIGAGAGQAGVFFLDFMAGVLTGDDAEKLDMGIIPAFVFDYGLIGTTLLLIFLISVAYNLSFPYWMSFVLIFPNCNINTQLFWFAITVCAYVSSILRAESSAGKNPPSDLALPHNIPEQLDEQ